MALGDREIERSLSRAKQWGVKRERERLKVKGTREAALERADRREWAHSRLGSEHRWQETVTPTVPSTRRRFVYDPATDAVVEI